MTAYIPCPECGQVVTVEVSENLTEKEKSDLALLHCGCPKGRAAALTKMQIDEAKLNIDELCGINASDGAMEPIESEETLQLLYTAVELIAGKKIFSVTVKLYGNSSVTVSVGTKGQIKVKRSLSVSEQLEANQKY